MKKVLIVTGIPALLIGCGLVYYFIFMKNLRDKIVIPYISHQRPRIDPHVPASVPIADKLDEILFDGLFNVSATPSGIAYEDGLGEFTGMDKKNMVSIRLKQDNNWHSSYQTAMEKDKISISPGESVKFTAQDLKFTMQRIKKLGSLSPDYILISQAVEDFDFTGPNENQQIYFQFRGDRVWSEADIKEVLSFKILPSGPEINSTSYNNGTGPYLAAGEYKEIIYYHKNPDKQANIKNVMLKPFIDNSTYTTELRSRNINVLLSTPFGAVQPILMDTGDYFHKSSIATCFFALFYNVKRLNLEQRKSLRGLVDNRKILNRFFKIGTEQQRHIANYKGAHDNYDEYLNNSVFPATSYYVEEQIVVPLADRGLPDLSILPDTVRIQTCLDFDYREELSELAQILSDPAMFGGKIKVSAVENSEIENGNYDAVLVAISGYRSNFLFDLYNIFLRQPDFSLNRIHLKTIIGPGGEHMIDPGSLKEDKNFFRLDLNKDDTYYENLNKFFEYIYGFMSTHEIGDKQAYARYIDELEQELVLGSWLFSLPSLAYFSTQFNEQSIDLYGIASQLSTIEKWQEAVKR
ncbi:MAG: hypothetical protein ABIA63_04220 [bacterium]